MSERPEDYPPGWRERLRDWMFDMNLTDEQFSERLATLVACWDNLDPDKSPLEKWMEITS